MTHELSDLERGLRPPPTREEAARAFEWLRDVAMAPAALVEAGHALDMWFLEAKANVWVRMADRKPLEGQLIVKRWDRNKAVWAGVYYSAAKNDSFDEWKAL